MSDPISVAATIVIPTHDHGALLSRALAAALAQTVTDTEVFVIGDGVSDFTRELVTEFMRRDPRIRFFDRPKGERHGELHRHDALGDAAGRVVCYLSDDDIWAPTHVATLSALLKDADWAHVLPVGIRPDGRPFTWAVDVTETSERQRLLGGENSVPLSCFGHTLAGYRRLPYGWHPAPPNVPTDLHMYQQFLAQDWCRVRSGFEPTALHFPAADRKDWTAEERGDELDRWLGVCQDPVTWADARLKLLVSIAHEHATGAAEYRRHKLLFDAWSAEINDANANLLLELEQLRETRTSGPPNLARRPPIRTRFALSIRAAKAALRRALKA